jgi:hypothetical protein
LWATANAPRGAVFQFTVYAKNSDSSVVVMQSTEESM